MKASTVLATVAIWCLANGTACAETIDASGDVNTLRAQIAAERAQLDIQQKALDAQRQRLDALQDSLLATLRGTGAPGDSASTAIAQQATSIPLPPSPPAASPSTSTSGVQSVGQAPTEQRQVQVAILAEQGGIITKKGRLTLESDLEYARSDRNDITFRGVQVESAINIGVFDIGQSRQDVLTAGLSARLGLTNRFEINGTIPFVYRSDQSVVAPTVDPNQPNPGQVTSPVNRAGLGDVNFGVRYQITDGHNGSPYLIAGVQALVPTGSDPFTVPRDVLGNALKGATGAGFWGISPSLTAILPTDPAVLFGTLGYTYNFGRNINRFIGTTFINSVRPGGEPSASVGIAISLNTRTSVSFGYAHTWAIGTKTITQAQDPNTLQPTGDKMRIRTRDLQLGRYLMGISYRANKRMTVNWNVEVGATQDAADVRTMLRIPITFDAFQ